MIEIYRSVAAATLLMCTLALSGCGSDEDLPDYTKVKVCGISSTTVAAVLDTRSFEVTGRPAHDDAV